MKNLFLTALLVLPFALLTSCSSDDNNPTVPVVVSKTYSLGSVSNPAISGTAKFIKNSDNSTTVELQLIGTTAGETHPAHIHFNTAAESGGIAVTLESVDGTTGFSTKTFSQLDDTTAITYDDMIAYNGYINVHVSATDLGTLVAQGDIGQNELTSTSAVYSLNEVATSGISGIVTFTERVNGNTLVILDLDGTVDGTDHLVHIHNGSVANSPGGIAITLNVVTGLTGLSATSVTQLNDATAIDYSGLVAFDGYLNIHASLSDLTVVAQGDIGANDN